MASQNGIYSALVYKAEMEKFWASTLPHKMCPRKQTTEPKWLILVSCLSGEVTSYTDICTSYCIHIHVSCGKYPVPFFFWATLYRHSSFLVVRLLWWRGRTSCDSPPPPSVPTSLLIQTIDIWWWILLPQNKESEKRLKLTISIYLTMTYMDMLKGTGSQCWLVQNY